TQMVKIRTLLYEGELCWDVDPTNGSCVAVSGRGYFNGDYSGFELTVKDTTRYNDPGGWVYLNFGEERPWMPAASPFPAASCNACHEANGGDDFVFTQFYPVLRDNDPKLKQSAVMPKMEKTALEPKTQMPAVESPLPTDLDALYKYLQDKEYRTFETADKNPHPSAGPHLEYKQPVKVYFSDAVAKSLEEGSDLHPKGSAVVKEIYADDNESLVGWAVSVKTDEDSDHGKGWFWVEFMSTEDSSKVPVPAGNGVALCSGCHAGGKDFVLSKLPE
ncbi:MAG: cytochrome P460 family protein, partial [Salaquimonas sp.]